MPGLAGSAACRLAHSSVSAHLRAQAPFIGKPVLDEPAISLC